MKKIKASTLAFVLVMSISTITAIAQITTGAAPVCSTQDLIGTH